MLFTPEQLRRHLEALPLSVDELDASLTETHLPAPCTVCGRVLEPDAQILKRMVGMPACIDGGDGRLFTNSTSFEVRCAECFAKSE